MLDVYSSNIDIEMLVTMCGYSEPSAGQYSIPTFITGIIYIFAHDTQLGETRIEIMVKHDESEIRIHVVQSSVWKFCEVIDDLKGKRKISWTVALKEFNGFLPSCSDFV